MLPHLAAPILQVGDFCLVTVTTDDESTVCVFSLQGHCSVGKVVHQEVFCGCFGWVLNHCNDQGGHLTRQTVGPQHKPDALQLVLLPL